MSGKSEYRNASDGHPARVSGSWAEDKLDALSTYSRIALRAVADKWNGVCYVDLMAGGGKCIKQSSGREFDGSPLQALDCNQPPFSRIVLIEADKRLCTALRLRTARAGDRVTVIEGDCNEQGVIEKVLAALPLRSLSIVFVDNLGLDVAWNTIRSLVMGRAMDLVVTFQVSDLKRNARLAMTNTREAGRWDRFFGTPEWRKVISDIENRRITANDLGTALGDFYADRFTTLGYTHRGQMNRTMTNTLGAPLYRVMLFSRHPLAKKLFAAASRGSQRNLDLTGG